MKKIIHLSDLHFGTQRPEVMGVLISEIESLKPDILIVSGDFTQRALIRQFKAAKIFLEKIEQIIPENNKVYVPGNHDISLHNLIERFFYPFNKYEKYISSSNFTSFCNDNIAILGINSVTPFKRMSGYVTESQLNYVTEFFQERAKVPLKIVVMHHNLIRSERHKIINDAEKIINRFSACNVNLILSGHIHAAHIESLKRDYLHHNMYIITAGTAISTRTIQPNSFNIIESHEKQFNLIVREFHHMQFITAKEVTFLL